MAWNTDVHATKKFRLGTEKKLGVNTYVYLKGCSSLVDADWVTFGSAYTAVRALANARGKVAIAQAAVDAATKYGWFLIDGSDSANVLASFDGTSGLGIWLTSTAGSVDDTSVDGDMIYGAMAETDVSGGVSTVVLNRPFVNDIVTSNV